MNPKKPTAEASARFDAPMAWSLRAVVRETGIGPHTLRSWERRYGFPAPVRLPSGHRRYPKDQVDRLLLVSRVLALGHRAGDVVGAAPSRLRALAGEDDASAGRSSRRWREAILGAVAAFDRPRASALLGREASRGVRPFLASLDTLLEEVGAAWAAGRLEIAHEHFLTELAGDLLRGLRIPLEAGARGPCLLLATLPGEAHALGIQAVALRAAAAGVPVRLLGPETPPAEVIRAALAGPTAAVGVSFSSKADPRAASGELDFLRQGLPGAVEVWAGGPGVRRFARLPEGICRIESPDRLEHELARLASASTEVAE